MVDDVLPGAARRLAPKSRLRPLLLRRRSPDLAEAASIVGVDTKTGDNR
jgi:hypothetical protein